MGRVRPSQPLPLRTRAFTRALHALGRFDVARMDLDTIRRGPGARVPGTDHARRPRRTRSGRPDDRHRRWPASRCGSTGTASTPASGAPVVVNLHGGGWVLGNLQQSEWSCSTLAARLGAVVVSVDYRLAPEHPAPAGFDDCWAVVRHLSRDASEVGGDATRVAVTGDSAGGNLAALVAIAHRDALRAGGPDAPAAPLRHQALVYPAVDLTLASPSIHARPHAPVLPRRNIDRFLEHYLTGSHLGPADPAVSPLHADLEDVAPALVITADNDPLEDDGERYADALRAAGVPVRYTRYERVPHGFLTFPGAAPAARQALAELVQELGARARLSTPGPTRRRGQRSASYTARTPTACSSSVVISVKNCRR